MDEGKLGKWEQVCQIARMEELLINFAQFPFNAIGFAIAKVQSWWSLVIREFSPLHLSLQGFRDGSLVKVKVG